MKYIDYNKELRDYFGIDRKGLDKMIKNADSVKEAWEREKVDKLKVYRTTLANLFRQANYRERRLVYYRRFLKEALRKEKLKSKRFNRTMKHTVLDYGSGIGDIGLVMAQLGYEVDLLEIGDSNFEKFIKWRFKRRYLPFRFIPYGDKLEDDYYDIIFNIDVLEHHEKPREALKDCHRALKKGGYLFFEISWHEREAGFKELGDLNANKEFIQPFIEENFEKQEQLCYVKK